MKLPNAENALITQDKLAGYLLDVGHRRGASKARLLHSMGYRQDNWQQLAEDLRRQHLVTDTVEEKATMWGTRYSIVAPLSGPAGDTVMFRSIWQVDVGSDRPRLVTMYPE